MNPKLGWALAAAAVVIGFLQYSWPGLVLALTVIVFWLLLQFSRAMRAMRLAGSAPVGQVPSAVMLHAKLRQGLRLIDLIQMTRSLGQKIGDEPERFRWEDESGASVEVELVDGRVSRWTLHRPAPAGDESRQADPVRDQPPDAAGKP